MSFGGSQPRQPHGREVSAEFRKRFAGRVNRTGRDGQLENYSRVRPGARGAQLVRERRGVAIPPGQLAPAQSAHAAFARRASRTGAYARGHGGGAAVDKPRQLVPEPPASPPRNYDPLETATSTLNVDDDYAAAVDDVYEAVEPSSARRRRTVSPVKRRVRDEAPPQKRGDARNEDLVRKPRDQLYYSRKARAVSNFKPYTLNEYRKTKPKEYIEFEPLRPNLNEDPALQEKRAKAAKLKAYSKELDRLNKLALSKQPKYQSPSPPPKQPTRLDKARVYAQTIPAPRQKSRGAAAAVVEAAAAPAPAEPVFASEDGGVYASDDDVDDGDLYKPTRLELLELQHDQRRAAAAEIRGAYGF